MEEIKLKRAIDALISFKNARSSDIIKASTALKDVKTLTAEVEFKLQGIFERLLKETAALSEGSVAFSTERARLVVKDKDIYDVKSPELLDFLDIHCPGMVNREPTVHPRAFQEFFENLDKENIKMLIKKGCLSKETVKYLDHEESQS